ncbi:cysteine methyltransferase [Metamycoplasma hyosynoviae]|uniref:methylated-DNA--[protein]-cysteine S-methyltransferase n=1 Tax=Metamycoplasma hyosynoviae TaxID=29559 RepID=UPI000460F767|nr:methylated-DNA--[protein]-cysteine S-methyltransferase [Metamycoplasma hyosynoviae]KDE42591.1 cysteine methyltransferase [Metamycoplasma hyosynoviae]
MIKTAIYKFPLGYLKLCYNEAGKITELSIIQKSIDVKNIPNSLTDLVYFQVLEYLKGSRKNLDFPYESHGTKFQELVWAELCKIPYGETRTYKQIAEAIGNPKAYRAVGSANNKNPIGLIVPCHRVIGINGKLVGYAAGVSIKDKLLELERNNK